MFQVADYLFIGSLIFASLLLTLLLVLWLNARRREVGILLALGLSKVQIAGQSRGRINHDFHPSLPSLSYGVLYLLAKGVGDTVAKNVTSGMLNKWLKNPLQPTGGGAGGRKTSVRPLTDIHMDIQPSQLSAGCLGRWASLDWCPSFLLNGS